MALSFVREVLLRDLTPGLMVLREPLFRLGGGLRKLSQGWMILRDLLSDWMVLRRGSLDSTRELLTSWGFFGDLSLDWGHLRSQQAWGFLGTSLLTGFFGSRPRNSTGTWGSLGIFLFLFSRDLEKVKNSFSSRHHSFSSTDSPVLTAPWYRARTCCIRLMLVYF